MINRYERQIKVATIGLDGQKKIKKKHILVVGTGGLGTYVTSELVRAGVQELTLVDPDIVELSNLQRQAVFNEEDVSHKLHKVTALHNRLSKVNSETKISAFPLYLEDFFKENNDKFDLIMDCTDNFEARLTINEYAKTRGIPFIFGSCAGTSGSFMFFDPFNGLELNDVFNTPQKLAPKNAKTVGTFTPIVPLVASYQVALALNYFVTNERPPYFYQLEAWPPELEAFKIKKRGE